MPSINLTVDSTIATIYFKKEDGEVLTGFMWLGVRPTGSLLPTREGNFGFLKIQ